MSVDFKSWVNVNLFYLCEKDAYAEAYDAETDFAILCAFSSGVKRPHWKTLVQQGAKLAKLRKEKLTRMRGF